MGKRAGLVVIAHKPCVLVKSDGNRIFTDGGFPAQMQGLNRAFEGMTILVPCRRAQNAEGLTPLEAPGLKVVPLTPLRFRGLARKLLFPLWLLRNALPLVRWLWAASAVHAVIPGDVGTIGMLGAYVLRRPLLIRHCGNWAQPATTAERFWKWFMERTAGGRVACFATGGGEHPPSQKNEHIDWIFSTSLTEAQLAQCHHRARSRGPYDGRLIVVARQERNKGTHLVIDALKLLRDRDCNARLVVVGDGSSLDRLRKQSASLGLSDHVAFTGRVPQAMVADYLIDADLFVFPTSTEGFPKVVLEALATGLPVITTRVSVLPHLLESGAGIILERAEPVEIADRLEETSRNTLRLQEMSEEAMRVSDRYSLERWSDIMHAECQRAMTHEV